MKIFFIVVLAVIMCLIGFISTAFYCSLPGFYWYHLLLQLGTLFITVPALNYWISYLKKLCNQKGN